MFKEIQTKKIKNCFIFNEKFTLGNLIVFGKDVFIFNLGGSVY